MSVSPSSAPDRTSNKTPQFQQVGAGIHTLVETGGSPCDQCAYYRFDHGLHLHTGRGASLREHSSVPYCCPLWCVVKDRPSPLMPIRLVLGRYSHKCIGLEN